MKINTWTIDEIEFLKKNLPVSGSTYCSIILNYPKSKIYRMGNILKLKINKNVKEKYKGKPNIDCNINPDFFYNIKLKEVAYFLGLLWSDGFLNKTKNSYGVGIAMSKDDVNNIKISLDKIGKWNYFEMKRKKTTWKDQIRFVTNNKRIYDFLVNNDYDKKSFISADKILLQIPKNLHPYFFRGLIDGDGCFYYKKATHSTMRQLSVASTYNQEWEYLEKLYKKLNVTYTIKRIMRKKSSYSIVRISNKDGIEKIGNYIYSNYENDRIGFNRKYAKYQLIITSPFTHTKFDKYNK